MQTEMKRAYKILLIMVRNEGTSIYGTI